MLLLAVLPVRICRGARMISPVVLPLQVRISLGKICRKHGQTGAFVVTLELETVAFRGNGLWLTVEGK